MKKRVRSILLWVSVILAVLVIGLIAAIEIQGNHALGEDGSTFQTAAAIAVAVLASGTTVLLAVLLASCKSVLGSAYDKIAKVAWPLLICAELTTLFWLRGGVETFRAAKDETNRAAAIEDAWKAEEVARLADLEDARKIPASVTDAQNAAQAVRERIATEAATAQNMDRDGDKTNDRLIAGQLALIESLKADLANLEASADRARADHGKIIAAASAAIETHRKTRTQLAETVATASDDRHQLDRWADDLVALVPAIPRPVAKEAAMLAICLPLMAFLYACLTGINAALAIEVEPEVEAVVAEEVSDTTIVPFPQPQEDDLDVMGKHELRQILRSLRTAGMVQNIPNARAISYMHVGQMRDLIRLGRAQWEETFSRQHRIA